MESTAEVVAPRRAAAERTVPLVQPAAAGGPARTPERCFQSSGEFLSFRLAHEEYGIDILKVQEIRSYERPKRIADAPPFVKGVVNLRGVIVPLVDLRLRFGLDRVEYDHHTVVIVLNVARQTIGVVVDGVSDVLRPAADQIKAAPVLGASLGEFITGIATIEKRMLILLDIEALIESADLAVASHASAENDAPASWT